MFESFGNIGGGWGRDAMKVTRDFSEKSIRDGNKRVKWKVSEGLLVLSDSGGPRLYFGLKVVLFLFIEAPEHRSDGPWGQGWRR